MKIQNSKALNVGMVTLLCLYLASCSKGPLFAPDYLVMPTDPFGSSIEARYMVDSKKTKKVEGELIAMEDDTLIILTAKHQSAKRPDSQFFIQKIDYNRIVSFRLHYAKMNTSKGYLASFILIPFHGLFMIITLPVNILNALLIENAEEVYFSFSKKNIQREDLPKYSRFPQGIPVDLNLDTLRPRDFKKK